MTIINDSILFLITVLHLLVVLFVLITPFSDSNYLLVLHVVVVPFIMIHWITNNNTCSLTMAEKVVREMSYGTKIEYKDCFIYQFIAPIYDFNKDHEAYSYFIYLVTGALWLLSLYNLNCKIYNNKIKNLKELIEM